MHAANELNLAGHNLIISSLAPILLYVGIVEMKARYTVFSTRLSS